MYKFHKSERLCSKKLIRKVFTAGDKFVSYPLEVRYCFVNLDYGLSCNQVVVFVPKRKVRSAVLRNRIRRQIKEAYRLNKHSINGVSSGTNVLICFKYLGDNLANINYKKLSDAVIACLLRILSNLKLNG